MNLCFVIFLTEISHSLLKTDYKIFIVMFLLQTSLFLQVLQVRFLVNHISAMFSQTGNLISYPFGKQFFLGQKSPLVNRGVVVTILEGEERDSKRLRFERQLSFLNSWTQLHSLPTPGSNSILMTSQDFNLASLLSLNENTKLIISMNRVA